jgi:hypothetical protein
MAFDPSKYDIQKWLDQETRRTLQKICNILDSEGRLVEEYKTRVDILPKGSTDPKSGNIFQAYGPALYRTYTWDADGNVVSSVPVMAEWTQACEDGKEGLLVSPLVVDSAPSEDTSNSVTNALTQLKIWEMKGLVTIEQIENEYNFDFVVLGDCNLVIDSTGQFVVIPR